jgi:L-fucose isomerase-like protein
LERSVRFAAALEALDDELGVDAGAMNCHVPQLRFAPDEPGITPCFALGRETTRGIPWSCAGDVITAVALLSVKLLGGAALYHEIETLDTLTDEALLANSGEHDLQFADSTQRPALQRNRWWASDRRCGACACFAAPPGPATLVAFTPHHAEPSGFRYIVAHGSFSERPLPETGTPHAAFRFAGGQAVTRAWACWVDAGVNHHSVATPGHLGGAVAALAHRLGVGCTRVS